MTLQLTRLSELEEMVAEQDNALAVAAEKYKKARDENARMKKAHEHSVNELKKTLARYERSADSDPQSIAN